MGLGGVAMAQSNASGVIFGNAGEAAGATVHVENVHTGQSREITVDDAGRYRATSLPVGTYTVTLKRAGQVIGSRDNVQVRVGSGTDVSFDNSALKTDASRCDRSGSGSAGYRCFFSRLAHHADG